MWFHKHFLLPVRAPMGSEFAEFNTVQIPQLGMRPVIKSFVANYDALVTAINLTTRSCYARPSLIMVNSQLVSTITKFNTPKNEPEPAFRSNL